MSSSLDASRPPIPQDLAYDDFTGVDRGGNRGFDEMMSRGPHPSTTSAPKAPASEPEIDERDFT